MAVVCSRRRMLQVYIPRFHTLSSVGGNRRFPRASYLKSPSVHCDFIFIGPSWRGPRGEPSDKVVQIIKLLLKHVYLKF